MVYESQLKGTHCSSSYEISRLVEMMCWNFRGRGPMSIFRRSKHSKNHLQTAPKHPKRWDNCKKCQDCLSIVSLCTTVSYTTRNRAVLGPHLYNINTKNCSLSIVLTATDQKPQKSLKTWYYPPSHCLNVNVVLSNMTFLMIFAVFDPSPLTLWIYCSF